RVLFRSEQRPRADHAAGAGAAVLDPFREVDDGSSSSDIANFISGSTRPLALILSPAIQTTAGVVPVRTVRTVPPRVLPVPRGRWADDTGTHAASARGRHRTTRPEAAQGDRGTQRRRGV